MKVRWIVKKVDRMAPQLKAVHSMAADSPEESTFLLMNSLVSLGFLLLGRLDAYRRWYFDSRFRVDCSTYRFLRDQLLLLQWQDQFSHWVLKSPLHLSGLGGADDRIFRRPGGSDASQSGAGSAVDVQPVFPHPRRIHPIASTSSRWDRRSARSWGECSSARWRLGRRLPIASRTLLIRTWSSGRSRPCAIFTRASAVTVDPAMESQQLAWLQANPRHKHGVHHYHADQFGIDLEAWTRKFGEYQGVVPAH